MDRHKYAAAMEGRGNACSDFSPREWRMIGSEGDFYVIRHDPAVEPPDDEWTCTCLGYRYQSKQHCNYACKHIRQAQEK